MLPKKTSEIRWTAASESRWAAVLRQTRRDFAALTPQRRQEASGHIAERLAVVTTWVDGARARGDAEVAHVFACDQELWQDVLDAVR